MSKTWTKLLFIALLIVVLVLIVLARPIPPGLDLAGGVELVYDISPRTPDGEIDATRTIDVDEVISLVRNRIDPQGFRNPVIEKIDDRHIRVQLPRIEPEEEQAIARSLENLGKLEFRLVEFVPGVYDSPLGMHVQLALQEAQRKGLTHYRTTVGENGKAYFWDYLPEVTYDDKITYTLTGDDFRDPLTFAFRLHGAARREEASPARRVWELLSDEARDVLAKTVAERRQGFADGTSKLVASLNDILKRPDFYTAEAFDEATIPPRAADRLDQGLEKAPQEVRVAVNRQLLDAVFVDELSPAGKQRRVTGYLWVRGSDDMLTGRDLTQVNVTSDRSGRPAIGFTFKASEAPRFGKLTGENIGKRLAVVLNDEIRQAPNINSRIESSGIIEGDFTLGEVRQAVQYIQQGSLPVKPVLVRKTSVGATLGQDLIRRSVTAAVWCGVCIVVFMLVYYLWSGAIAVVGLGLNMLIILAVMALFGQTLWLAGIVGLLLTVGMSVDANVLIFERMREEQEAGRGLAMCVQKGYGRAAGAIFDANLTTIFTAIALYMTGMPQLKSFSFTLGVGILGSMFCALFVTRVLFDLIVEKRLASRVPMLKLIRETAVPFMKRAHWAILLSGAGILVGLYVFFFREVSNPLRFAWQVLGLSTADLPGVVAVVVRLVLAAALLLALLWLLKVYHRTLAEHEQAGGEGGGAPVGQYRTGPVGMAALGVAAYVAAALVVFFVYGAIVSRGVSQEAAERPAMLTSIEQVRYGVLRNMDIDFRSGGRIDLMLARQGSLSPEDVEKTLSETFNEKDIRVDGIRLVGPDGKWKTAEFAVDCAGVPPSEVIKRIREAYADAIELNDLIQDGPQRVKFGLKRMTLSRDKVDRILAETGMTQYDVQTRSGSETVAMRNESGMFSIRFQARGGREFEAAKERIAQAMAEYIDREAVAVRFQEVAVQEAAGTMRMGVKVLPVAGTSRALTLEGIRSGLARMKEKFQAVDGLKGTDVVLEQSRLPEGDSFIEFTVYMDKPSAEMVSRVRQAAGEEATESEALARYFNDNFGDSFMVVRAFGNESFLSPSEANKTVANAIMAIFMSLFFIVAYVWFRFGSLRYGLAAITALVHDVLLTLGAVAIADVISGSSGALWQGINRALMIGDVKIGLGTVAAFLTLIGYSLNDTIVVFDRIRENLHGNRRLVPDVINRSINQMLGRTILTSVTTLIVVVVQYIFGGSSIHSLCFVLIVGVLVGTYSSIFIASPILIWSHVWRKGGERAEQ